MYISESEAVAGRGARRQKPGACPDERCHNAFFVGDDGRSTLERTTYRAAPGVMIACWSTDIGPVITELISQFTDTRRDTAWPGRAGPGRAGQGVRCVLPARPVSRPRNRVLRPRNSFGERRSRH